MTRLMSLAVGAARGRLLAARQALPGSRRLMDLSGRTALVTGGGGGIGRCVAHELADRGARVAILDADGDAAERAASAVGRAAIGLQVDVRDRSAMATAVAQVAAINGDLGVVVANAGVAPRPATLRTIDPDDYDRVIGVNQTGVFNTIQPAIEAIIASRGHVVVVASVAAFAPGIGGAPYMASKAAVEQLGRALRIELAAHQASAGVSYFGIVETAMTRSTIDDDPLVRLAEQLLPSALQRRITAQEAASVLVDGIQRRAASTMAPAAWRAWALTRGLTNIFVDDAVSGDPYNHDLVAQLEARTGHLVGRPAKFSSVAAPKEDGRRARGAETRSRSVAAALELFAGQGYSATSVAMIAAAANVNSQSIYHAFGSKEGLLAAAMEQAADGFFQELRTVVEAPSNGDAIAPARGNLRTQPAVSAAASGAHPGAP